ETPRGDIAVYSPGQTITCYGDLPIIATEVDRMLWETFTAETGVNIQFIQGGVHHGVDDYDSYRQICQDRGSGVDVIMLDAIWVQSLAPWLLDLSHTL